MCSCKHHLGSLLWSPHTHLHKNRRGRNTVWGKITSLVDSLFTLRDSSARLQRKRRYLRHFARVVLTFETLKSSINVGIFILARHYSVVGTINNSSVLLHGFSHSTWVPLRSSETNQTKPEFPCVHEITWIKYFHGVEKEKFGQEERNIGIMRVIWEVLIFIHFLLHVIMCAVKTIKRVIWSF